METEGTHNTKHDDVHGCSKIFTHINPVQMFSRRRQFRSYVCGGEKPQTEMNNEAKFAAVWDCADEEEIEWEEILVITFRAWVIIIMEMIHLLLLH